MITNDGKEIISKFILGQVPAFATHLSIGCGARPLSLTDSYPSTAIAKSRMDFEMTRVPISSKGFVDDSETYLINNKALTSNKATLTLTATHNIIVGETIVVSGIDTVFNGQYTVTETTSNTVSYSRINTNVTSTAIPSPYANLIVSRTKVSLTAELPTADRYEITEVALWSAGNNTLAGTFDSRMVFNFSQNWFKHNSAGVISTPSKYDLGSPTILDINTISRPFTDNVFYAPTNDILFQNATRKARKEGPRYLNTTLLVRGDMSTISPAAGGSWTTTTLKNDWVGSGDHIHINDINFDISGNNASDIVKLAFSVIDNLATGANVDDVKILIEFFKNESTTATNFAKMQIHVPGTGYLNYDVNNSNTGKYYVAAAELSQNIDYSNYNTSTNLVSSLSAPYVRFYTSSTFSPGDIRMARIYVAVTASSVPSTAHYISFDGFRIDSTVENPVYKMCGYSIVRKDGKAISKLANTNNYIDFRFSLGVA